MKKLKSSRKQLPLRQRRFPAVVAGEWIKPTPDGYLMKCCDCGLVHKFNFRVVFQAFRMDRTARGKRGK